MNIVFNHNLRFLRGESSLSRPGPIVREQPSKRVDGDDILGLSLRPKNPFHDRFTIGQVCGIVRDDDPVPIKDRRFFPIGF